MEDLGSHTGQRAQVPVGSGYRRAPGQPGGSGGKQPSIRAWGCLAPWQHRGLPLAGPSALVLSRAGFGEVVWGLQNLFLLEILVSEGSGRGAAWVALPLLQRWGHGVRLCRGVARFHRRPTRAASWAVSLRGPGGPGWVGALGPGLFWGSSS